MCMTLSWNMYWEWPNWEGAGRHNLTLKYPMANAAFSPPPSFGLRLPSPATWHGIPLPMPGDTTGIKANMPPASASALPLPPALCPLATKQASVRGPNQSPSPRSWACLVRGHRLPRLNWTYEKWLCNLVFFTHLWLQTKHMPHLFAKVLWQQSKHQPYYFAKP